MKTFIDFCFLGIPFLCVVDSASYCYGLLPRYGERWAPKTKEWIAYGQQFRQWIENGKQDPRPKWNKKKPKTTSNSLSNVQYLLQPLVNESNPNKYHIFFDKEFATQAILDWLEKKGKLQEHNY